MLHGAGLGARFVLRMETALLRPEVGNQANGGYGQPDERRNNAI